MKIAKRDSEMENAVFNSQLNYKCFVKFKVIMWKMHGFSNPSCARKLSVKISDGKLTCCDGKINSDIRGEKNEYNSALVIKNGSMRWEIHKSLNEEINNKNLFLKEKSRLLLQRIQYLEEKQYKK